MTTTINVHTDTGAAFDTFKADLEKQRGHKLSADAVIVELIRAYRPARVAKPQFEGTLAEGPAH